MQKILESCKKEGWGLNSDQELTKNLKTYMVERLLTPEVGMASVDRFPDHQDNQ